MHSIDSTSSSHTSLSSSSEVYEEKLKRGIEVIKSSEIPLEELVEKAETLINEVLAPDTRHLFTHENGDSQLSVELDKVILAMITYAEECGGKDGKRYVASAVIACSEEEDAIQALAALGTTWLTHLLFVFKAKGHSNQANMDPSELATPTVDDTASCLEEGVGDRKESFADDVKRRDSYVCVVTGAEDYLHPNSSSNNPITVLEAAHILRRAIGEYDSDHKSSFFRSAVTTFDILTNFSRLAVKTLEELRNELDSPKNGLSLELNAHRMFDKYYWCLKPTEQANVYRIKIFKYENAIIRRPAKDLVSFVDKSVSDSTGTRKRSRPVDLPNPHYLAIHAAIAGVLNMSGAGKFFDELFTMYRDGEGNAPAVRCWEEMEEWMDHTMLRESVYEAFQSVRVN
ncbi:hypothetical protein BJ165DRAFT_1615629 [Panaeolus papilionaceus]|nr:hypothetical protein BJ165DRAFT_1615629 [Panaeolus papilionaceus]